MKTPQNSKYKYVIGFAAFIIAACAGYFSVTGIAKLFGGNAIQIGVMAAALEFGKLVCASAAYRLKDSAPRWVRWPLIFFTIVMMGITSLGIFGYLSSSYQTVSNEFQADATRIESVETKKDLFQDRIARFDQERGSLLDDKESLRSQLQEASSQYAERGWATDQQAVERLQSRIETVDTQLDNLNGKISAFTDSVAQADQRLLELRTQDSDVKEKLGPLLFVASAFDTGMDTAVKWFILILISVFDPMAVVLVIAYNVMDERDRVQPERDDTASDDPKKTTVEQDTPDDVEVVREQSDEPDETSDETSSDHKPSAETVSENSPDPESQRNEPSPNAEEDGDDEITPEQILLTDEEMGKISAVIQEISDDDEETIQAYIEDLNDTSNDQFYDFSKESDVKRYKEDVQRYLSQTENRAEQIKEDLTAEIMDTVSNDADREDHPDINERSSDLPETDSEKEEEEVVEEETNGDLEESEDSDDVFELSDADSDSPYKPSKTGPKYTISKNHGIRVRPDDDS